MLWTALARGMARGMATLAWPDTWWSYFCWCKVSSTQKMCSALVRDTSLVCSDHTGFWESQSWSLPYLPQLWKSHMSRRILTSTHGPSEDTLTHFVCRKPPRLCVLLLLGPPGLINIVKWYLADKRQQRPGAEDTWGRTWTRNTALRVYMCVCAVSVCLLSNGCLQQ